MPIVVNGMNAEYTGQLDASGTKPEGCGIAFISDKSVLEGRWYDGQLVHGRELGKNGKDLFVGFFENNKAFGGDNIHFDSTGEKFQGNLIQGKENGWFSLTR